MDNGTLLYLALIFWGIDALWCAANVYGSVQARKQWHIADRLMRHANSDEYRQLRDARERQYVLEAIKEWEEDA